MPSQIHSLGQKIISFPRYIANCIARFGSYVVKQCNKIINYITHKNDESANINSMADRQISTLNPQNTADLLVEKFQLDRKTVHSVVTNLLIKKQFIPNDCKDNKYLDACYLYISNLWGKRSGQSADCINGIHASSASQLEEEKELGESQAPSTGNKEYISYINMMLNLFYHFKQENNQTKAVADYVIEIQKDVNNNLIDRIREEIITAQNQVYAISSGNSNPITNSEQSNINLSLFLHIVAASLKNKLEDSIINLPLEDLQKTVNKIFMFQQIAGCAEELYRESGMAINPTDCYLLAYSALAKDDIELNNIVLPKINRQESRIIEEYKQQIPENIPVDMILKESQLAQLDRRDKIDSKELSIAEDIDDSYEKICAITDEKHDLVIYTTDNGISYIYNYDVLRACYIKSGVEPMTNYPIDFTQLQKIVD